MLTHFSVGIVLKPHGLKGELKVKPLTDEPARFDKLERVYVKQADGYKEYHIKSTRYDKGFVYLKLSGVDSIESASALRNQYFWIPRSEAIALPEDSYFIGDLIGSSVKTIQGNTLGTLTDVIQTGSNDVYVVKGNKGEVLIPALKSVVKNIDIRAGLVTVDLTNMEGLLDDEV
ncbi:MAG TPA: ribosome maturation factor RimM [Candidatus Atribacteria bacterium]|nr:ribosome maturation factor RimM [Candidatus Atribacteria bacterium]